MSGKLLPLRLEPHEREALERWKREPKRYGALAIRAEVVLRCATGAPNSEVAQDLRVHRETVGKWRSRFLETRVRGLHDEPRPGAPRRITDRDVERVIVLTLDHEPEDSMRWSTRSMADATGISPSTIARIWRRFALTPQSGHLVSRERREEILAVLRGAASPRQSQRIGG